MHQWCDDWRLVSKVLQIIYRMASEICEDVKGLQDKLKMPALPNFSWLTDGHYDAQAEFTDNNCASMAVHEIM